jgi:hypothetical protein
MFFFEGHHITLYFSNIYYRTKFQCLVLGGNTSGPIQEVCTYSDLALLTLSTQKTNILMATSRNTMNVSM